MLSRARIFEAIRFWEVARVPYNLVLALIVLGGAFATGELWRQWVLLSPILVALAIGANIAYCAAYPVDLVLQLTPLCARRRVLRYALWGAGTLLAALIAVAMLYGMMAFSSQAWTND